MFCHEVPLVKLFSLRLFPLSNAVTPRSFAHDAPENVILGNFVPSAFKNAGTPSNSMRDAPRNAIIPRNFVQSALKNAVIPRNLVHDAHLKSFVHHAPTTL